MSIDVLQIFWLAAFDIARDIQIVLIGNIDFLIRHKSGILGIRLIHGEESGHDFMNILFPQAVLVAVLYIAFAGVS